MMYVYGLDHVELGEHFLALTNCPLICEGRSSSYGRWTSWDHGNNGDNNGETGETKQRSVALSFELQWLLVFYYGF